MSLIGWASVKIMKRPANVTASRSIASLPMEERIRLAHHSISSRVYDALLSSPTVSQKSKRIFVTSFLGHYNQLVDDRFGSRVADRCWDFADTYLKVSTRRNEIPCGDGLYSHRKK